jgi:hypothetical protein
MNRKELIYIPAAMAIGGGLWFVMNMNPVWWLAWFLPGLLFAIALRTEAWTSRGLVALAALIGASSNLGYFIKVMPLVPTMIVLLLLALVWVVVFGAARRIVKTWEAAWTVLALPVVSVALDTLLAHFTPDGNFGSLGYTQAEMLPVAQFAALFGVGGILFLVMLANSALAFAIHYGLKLRGAPVVYGGTVLAIILAVGFGTWRLQAMPEGPSVSFGIASVDDFIGSPRSSESRDVWTQYEAQVQELAASGAKVILLPEKIAVLRVPGRRGTQAVAWRTRAQEPHLAGRGPGRRRRQAAAQRSLVVLAGRTAGHQLPQAFHGTAGARVRAGQRVPRQRHRRRALRRGHLQGHALREPGPRLRAEECAGHADPGLGTFDDDAVDGGQHDQAARRRERLPRGALIAQRTAVDLGRLRPRPGGGAQRQTTGDDAVRYGQRARAAGDLLHADRRLAGLGLRDCRVSHDCTGVPARAPRAASSRSSTRRPSPTFGRRVWSE